MNYLDKIKNIIEKNEINQKKYNYYKNTSLVETYFNIGKLLVEAQGGKNKTTYGNKLIKTWSVELTKIYGKGYIIQIYVDLDNFILLLKMLPQWGNI